MKVGQIVERQADTTASYATAVSVSALARETVNRTVDAGFLSWTDALALAEVGQRWLRDCAEQHVDAAFVDSFLHRNPVHAALLTLG